MFFSHRIYFTILAHILLILLTAGAGGWLVLSHHGYVIGSILILCAFFQIGALAKKLNSFNRKIRLFLDAIEDRENMLHFPERTNYGSEQQALYQALNRINALLADAKAQTRAQEHFYQSLIEEVPTGIVAWDNSGNILLANSAAFTLLRCKRLDTHAQVLQQCDKDDNRKRLSLSEKKMVLAERPLTLLSIKDIGDELNDRESESWNKLTHVLTHEIMNTIAPIISLAQTLERLHAPEEATAASATGIHPAAAAGATGIPSAIGHGISIIRSQSERLMEFTESFRHLSYLPLPNKQTFSFTEMVNNLVELLQSDFEMNGIRFTLTSDPQAISIHADRNQLSQVFLNLLKNAMQALEERDNGEITLSIRQAERLWIEVTDNGAGIPPEIREQVFVPFFTTKTEGTGIGLSLCRQIIRHHGGHINITESRPGRTTFQIDLPI